jgi:hypothetical protein
MNKTRERIQKLLALAADQAGTPEGELAARMARRLLRERAWALAGLSPGERRRAEPYLRQPLALGGEEAWRRRLGGAVARHCACRLAWSWSRRQASLYGPESGVAITEYLFAVTSRRISEGCARYLSERQVPEALRPQADRAYCHSAVLALEARLERLRLGEAAVDPEGDALVLAGARDLDAWLREKGLTARPPPHVRHDYSQDGYDLGRAIPLQDAVCAGEDPGALEAG